MIRQASCLMILVALNGCQESIPTDHSAELTPIIELYVWVWNTGQVDALDEIIASHYRMHFPSDDFPEPGSLEELKALITRVRKVRPEIRVSLKEVHFLKNRSSAQWEFHTDVGTENTFSYGLYENGKLAEEWVYFKRRHSTVFLPPK